MRLRRRRFMLSVMLVAGLLPSASRAGAVLTINQRHEGSVTVQPGAVQAGSVAVKWADVILVVNDKKADPAPPPNALRFRNGETWAGKVTKFSDNRVTIESTLLGPRKVEIGQLRAIEFAPGLGPVEDGPSGSGTLFRANGSSVPGSLVWIQETRVAVNTPLGAVALDRDGLSRYVFGGDAAKAAAPAGDEVTLADGSVIRAVVEPVQGAFVVRHTLLGEMRLGPDAWRSVRRCSGPALYLADIEPASVRTFPLIRVPAAKPKFEQQQGGSPGFVSRILIWPQSALGYKIPGQAGEKYLFTAGIRLLDGSRGSARVKARVDGKAVFDQVLAPDARSPVPVSFEVSSGSDLTLEVDFDNTIRFPCVVTIDNALLVKK